MGKTSKPELPSGAWSDRLQCHWLAWMELDDGNLVLLVPEGNVPDMTGCVGIACALMPEVVRVMVNESSMRHQLANVCRYELHDGSWKSMGAGMSGALL